MICALPCGGGERGWAKEVSTRRKTAAKLKRKHREQQRKRQEIKNFSYIEHFTREINGSNSQRGGDGGSQRVARRTAAAVCKKVLNTLIWRWSCVGNRCMKNYHNTKICAPSRQTSTHIVQHSLYDNGRCFKLPQCRKWLQTYKTLYTKIQKNRKEQLCILYRCFVVVVVAIVAASLLAAICSYKAHQINMGLLASQCRTFVRTADNKTS
ncbi:unnamed protein product [Ceratitis capitata]|uniref:(Mediterranean fruit fly) hypothetical protein n=1 Tax=Ceratitis capitata TaxID=7213 RepID=A0A811UGR4_CERCA|nr:unnamed protein product [Ceratitis capitata]